jgi:hypothetical protein
VLKPETKKESKTMSDTIKQLIKDAELRIDTLIKMIDDCHSKALELSNKIGEAQHYGKYAEACQLSSEMANTYAKMDAYNSEIVYIKEQIEMNK